MEQYKIPNALVPFETREFRPQNSGTDSSLPNLIYIPRKTITLFGPKQAKHWQINHGQIQMLPIVGEM